MDILRLENLGKDYGDFKLKDVNIRIPQGCIMGLIGENGAGKSTLIKTMLDLVHRDSGNVRMFGKEYREDDLEMKEHIGVVMDGFCFSDELSVENIGKIMEHIFKTWDVGRFQSYVKNFALPLKKPVKDFSRGMKMKLTIAVAMSHDTRLLILDEATSGLDPVVRQEMLDAFLEFIQSEENSVFISSHILSDLEKVCDYITYLHDGQVLFSENKDELIEMYRIVKCSGEALDRLDKRAVAGVRKHTFGIEALVRSEAVPDGMLSDAAGIEDIMLFFSKRQGERS